MYKKAILLAYTLACFSFLAIACADSEVDETGKEPILPQIEVSKVATEMVKLILRWMVSPSHSSGHKYALMPCSTVTK